MYSIERVIEACLNGEATPLDFSEILSQYINELIWDHHYET